MMGQGNTPNLTEEELAQLTDEEREGLMDDSVVDDEPDDDDGDAAAKAAVEGAEPAAKEDPAKKPDAEDPDDDTAAERAAAAEGEDDPADPAKATDPGKEAASEDDPPAAEQPKKASRGPLPDWKAPENYEQSLKDLQTKQDELDQKFEDGELTAAEWRTENRKLQAQTDELKEANFKATMSIEARVDAWTNETVPNWLQEHPEYKVGSARYKLLDAEVRALQDEAEDPLSPEILEKAHAKIEEELGLKPAKTPEKPDPKPAENAEDPEKPKNKREIPPTLGNAPAAAVETTVDNSKFAAIDRLEGEEYEAAIAKLSEPELNEYLAR